MAKDIPQDGEFPVARRLSERVVISVPSDGRLVRCNDLVEKVALFRTAPSGVVDEAAVRPRVRVVGIDGTLLLSHIDHGIMISCRDDDFSSII